MHYVMVHRAQTGGGWNLEFAETVHLDPDPAIQEQLGHQSAAYLATAVKIFTECE